MAAAVGVVLLGAGCRSAGLPTDFDRHSVEQAVQELSRPLSGDLGALYRLRVSSSGGLRLSLLTRGERGRMTVSEPFGSAVSMTAWDGAAAPEFFDLRAGCHLPAVELSAVLGVGSLPLAQAVRLLGGRLPAEPGDGVDIGGTGVVTVSGQWGSGRVTLGRDPWRVVLVEQQSSAENGGWKIRLDRHTLSVPGWLRVEGADGRWAELELVRLEWDELDELPPVPRLPRCDTGVEGAR
jgi:hypothetical protein